MGRDLIFRSVLSVLMVGTVATSQAADCLVAIDIGHTRQRPGATSARGVAEWEFNSELAKTVLDVATANRLPATLLNRSGDPQPLENRTRAAMAAGATLFVSIHHDSVQPRYLSPWEWEGRRRFFSDSFNGYGLFVSAKNSEFAESQSVAMDMADVLLSRGLQPSLHHAEPIPGENRPLLDATRGIYQFDDLIVLKTAAMPAVLVEAGVIVNRDEELRVVSPQYREKIAQAILFASTSHCSRLRSRNLTPPHSPS